MVITDIVMPEMDGYALCKALRADEGPRHLPVILLTSLTDPRDVIKGLESGANNFICKPYDDRALLARVRNVLANEEIRKATPSEMGINIYFAGQRFFITADRLQILDLLLSTYKNAVERNGELTRTRDELRSLNEQLETRVAERTATLAAEVATRTKAEERVLHLNSVLRAIRNVNQLIVREKDVEQLIKQACEYLVEARGYHHIWIATVDEAQALQAMAEAGPGKGLSPLDAELRTGKLPACCSKARLANGAATIVDHADCAECPLREGHGIGGSYAAALLHATRCYGYLVMSLPPGFVRDKEEEGLLSEAAGDIAFALYGIEQEQKKARAEEALRQSEGRFRVLFEQAADSILVLEIMPGGGPVIRDANSATSSILGYKRDELIGQPVALINEAPNASRFVAETREAILSKGGRSTFEVKHRCKDGTFRDFECSTTEMQIGSKAYALSVERDVTERKQAEEERKKLETQVLQSQKMESVGQLAGGVAHDFNNLLTAILGYTVMAMDSLPSDSSARPKLAQVQAAGLRAADLTRQLLLFSRRELMEPLPIDVNRTINNTLKLLRRLIGEDIAVTTALSEKPWIVRADEGKLEQVIMNLAINARDAMPAGGSLTLTTENVTLDAAKCSGIGDSRPGNFVRLCVADTGTGISEQVLKHLFEPFFTTKVVGKGTGLGLSVVYGIVKQHEGWINVATAPGKGTTFAVYLPATPGEKPATRSIQAPVEALRGSGERVLLIEDDAAVRDLAEQILSGNGYEVVAAASLAEGLRCFREQAGRFALLFTDVVLPDGTGLQVVDQVRATAPHLPVLLASGYTDEKSQAEIIQGRGLPFLRKPYDVAGLLSAVRRAMRA
jgi:PAS domain S-box-containing protein